VVESSTKEEIFTPTDDWRARMVWLQQEKTVGDQEFKSFALFTGEDQPMIITSKRANLDHATGRGIFLSTEVKTVTGAAISLIGFFAQFIGTRGMHWSASIATLVAILIMTAVRAWVRHGLNTPILAEPLLPGFELDWFADTFKDPRSAKWYKTYVNATDEGNESVREEISIPTHNSNDAQLQTSRIDSFDVQKVYKIRQHLAKISDWRGPVSKEAVAITRAMEDIMNILNSELASDEVTSRTGSRYDYYFWDCKIRHEEHREQTLRLKIMKRGDKWKANAGEVEAALSLKLFYTKVSEQTTQLSAEILSNSEDTSDDEWLREKGSVSELGIRVLGDRSTFLQRHLEWWVPADRPKMLIMYKPESLTDRPKILEIDNIGKSATKSSQISAIESVYAGSNRHRDMIIKVSRIFGFEACCQKGELGANNIQQSLAPCSQDLLKS
jgi:hypothetical protein